MERHAVACGGVRTIGSASINGPGTIETLDERQKDIAFLTWEEDAKAALRASDDEKRSLLAQSIRARGIIDAANAVGERCEKMMGKIRVATSTTHDSANNSESAQTSGGDLSTLVELQNAAALFIHIAREQ